MKAEVKIKPMMHHNSREGRAFWHFGEMNFSQHY